MENKYYTIRDREAMIAPAYWTGLSTVSSNIKKLYETKPITCYDIFDNQGRILVIYFNEEYNYLTEYIGYRLFSDKNYFEKIKNEIDKRKIQFTKFLNKLENTDFKTLNNQSLISLAQEFPGEAICFEEANLFGWCFGAEGLSKILYNHLDIPEEDFLILATPKIKTAVNQVEFEILNSLRKILNKDSRLEEEVKNLSSRFGPIPHGFDGMEYWDEKHFLKRINDEYIKGRTHIAGRIEKIESLDKKLEEKINSLIIKHNFSEEQTDLINRLNETAVWTDERRLLTYKNYYFYHLILREFEKRFNLPFKNLKHLFTDELFLLMDNLKKAIEISSHRIENGLIMYFEKGSYEVRDLKEREGILNELHKGEQDKALKGMIASNGPGELYRGKVKVLLSPKECKKVEEGDFLVATMTTPDYIIAMEKAKGFITDEGGVTCHAAIVAREMKKPCLIATKNATKVLKDGDQIELNTITGEIKKL